MVTRRPTRIALGFSVALLAVSLALFLLDHAPLGFAIIAGLAVAWATVLAILYGPGSPRWSA